MNEKTKKVLARISLNLFISSLISIYLIIRGSLQIEPHPIIVFPIVISYYYVVVFFCYWIINRVALFGETEKYKELFWWWFWWGTKATLVILFAGITYRIALNKLQPATPIKDFADFIRTSALLLSFIISPGLILGLLATGVKKIIDDGLHKIIQFWK